MEKQAKQIADSKNLVIDYIAGTKEKGVYMLKAISGEVVRFNKEGIVNYKWKVIKKSKISSTYKYGAHILRGFQYNWSVLNDSEYVNSFKKKQDAIDFIESIYC